MNSFQLDKPDKALFSMTIRLRLEQWRKLANQFDDMQKMSDPAYYLIQDIRSMVEQAEKEFLPSIRPDSQ